MNLLPFWQAIQTTEAEELDYTEQQQFACSFHAHVLNTLFF